MLANKKLKYHRLSESGEIIELPMNLSGNKATRFQREHAAIEAEGAKIINLAELLKRRVTELRSGMTA